MQNKSSKIITVVYFDFLITKVFGTRIGYIITKKYVTEAGLFYENLQCRFLGRWKWPHWAFTARQAI